MDVLAGVALDGNAITQNKRKTNINSYIGIEIQFPLPISLLRPFPSFS